MAILSQVGRRSWKSRLMVTHIYTVLIIGAVTMVVPFLLMINTSVSDGVDDHDYALAPATCTTTHNCCASTCTASTGTRSAGG